MVRGFYSSGIFGSDGFGEWDPGRKRVGIAQEITNLHQDYTISKQGKVHDDLIRGDQSGLIGLQGDMKKTGIDRGWKILRSTIDTDTCDLGSSSGDGLDNKEVVPGKFGLGY
ncbi:hypothetical protein IGI04_029966 [Brassica rapa subsp. trilocularis]|uniref:RIN4 pathogenic type III effector avirulence factor Avr cleavage site domain-containing protein n=1 Tax=Brassica rapa subsp. trilocularis TaxID=1813537 RepID=A0ABQ7LPB7_BRACM|nr:hypothetical protein IGI04_029966 [Brassica rapa subsp. trilocularis]